MECQTPPHLDKAEPHQFFCVQAHPQPSTGKMICPLNLYLRLYRVITMCLLLTISLSYCIICFAGVVLHAGFGRVLCVDWIFG